MKARIEKKLSKRLVEIAPKFFKDAWQADHEEPSELAYQQGTCVSGVYYVGGGTDYWGEGQDAYTVWEFWKDSFYWHGDFPAHPEGHQYGGYPDLAGFKETARNLLDHARRVLS